MAPTRLTASLRLRKVCRRHACITTPGLKGLCGPHKLSFKFAAHILIIQYEGPVRFGNFGSDVACMARFLHAGFSYVSWGAALLEPRGTSPR
jgi:hypothetical protein